MLLVPGISQYSLNVAFIHEGNANSIAMGNT